MNFHKWIVTGTTLGGLLLLGAPLAWLEYESLSISSKGGGRLKGSPGMAEGLLNHGAPFPTPFERTGSLWVRLEGKIQRTDIPIMVTLYARSPHLNGLRITRHVFAQRLYIDAIPMGRYDVMLRQGLVRSPLLALTIKNARRTEIRTNLVDWRSNPFPPAHYTARIQFLAEESKADFRSQCGFCHQMGNPQTRIARSQSEWEKIIAEMVHMGALLKESTRNLLASVLATELADQPAEGLAIDDSLESEAMAARIVEWPFGDARSFIHDIALDGNNRAFGVDMENDRVLTIDRFTGDRQSWKLPFENHPRGGYLRGLPRPLGLSNAHLAPHSVEYFDKNLWITASLSNEIIVLSPETLRTKHWSIPKGGFYPHTIRVRDDGAWFTLALSGHLGFLDFATNEIRLIRLPRSNLTQTLLLPFLGFFFGRAANHPGESLDFFADEGASTLPMPYGIDIGPDGRIWYSRLNDNRIGVFNPQLNEIKEWPTPFEGPRRLAVDASGIVWIPGFASGTLGRFDPQTQKFSQFPIPAVPNKSELPYAVAIHPNTQDVWIAATALDSIYRFIPGEERFIRYPLPTHAAFLREIEFGKDGEACASYSVLPRTHMPDPEPGLVCVFP